MALSSPGWLFLPGVIAGLVLALWMPRGLPGRVGRPIRIALFLLLAATWVLLLWLWTRPYRARTETVFHPPVLVLAVDQSPSFAGGDAPWLNSGEALRRQSERLRAHFSGLGFRWVEIGFGTRVAPAGFRESSGNPTRLSALRSHIDSLAIPNLQAIFLWSDGRFIPENGGDDWPAPLFPLVAGEGGSGEVQGEVLNLDFSRPDSGVRGNLEWRCLRPGPCVAGLEMSADGLKIWKVRVSGSMDSSGHRMASPIRFPRGIQAAASARWSAILKPEKPADNALQANDTVFVRIVGGRKLRNLFARPLRTLEERGLMDALHHSDSLEASALIPDSLETGTREGDAVWLPPNAGARLEALAPRTAARGIPVVHYRFLECGKAGSFSADARVWWERSGDPFVSAALLRLADLGYEGVALPPPGPGSDRHAWIEERGNTGIMVSTRKGEPNQWDVAIPALWFTGFRAEVDARMRRNQEEWVQGIARWIRFERKTPFDSQHTRQALPAKPVPIVSAYSLLGIDVERLSALAEAAHGRMLPLKPEGLAQAFSGYPEFSAGQIAEEKSVTRPLAAPGSLALVAGLLLSVFWAMRKLARLD